MQLPAAAPATTRPPTTSQDLTSRVDFFLADLRIDYHHQQAVSWQKGPRGPWAVLEERTFDDVTMTLHHLS